MYLSHVHIDGFGVLSGQTITDLPQGCSIFLGHNEAGKSTCLDFFRAMLAGYPRAKAQHRLPLGGGQAGGTLTLHTQRCGVVRLTRRPGPRGGDITLTDAAGNRLDPTLESTLLQGITPELYRNVYGFSLDELQTFASLNDEGVRNALYGASFGQGVRSPGAIMGQLTTRMDDMFKPNGSKPRINALLKELDDVRALLRNHENDRTRYDELGQQRADLTQQLHHLRTSRTEQEALRHQLERRVGAWQQWEEWALVQERLQRVTPVVEHFPQDGVVRLEQALERQQERQRTVAVLAGRLEQTALTLQTLAPDLPLLEATPLLHTLTESKASYREALAQLPALEAEHARALAARDSKLAQLGPGWTMERVRLFDRSLFTRKDCEDHASHLAQAQTALAGAATEVTRREDDVAEATHQRELVLAKRNALPALPEATLPPGSEDALAAQLARAENALEEYPAAQAALAHAEDARDQSLAALPFSNDAARNTCTLHQLATLAAARDTALGLARDVLTCHTSNAEARRRVSDIAAQHDLAAQRVTQAAHTLQEHTTHCAAQGLTPHADAATVATQAANLRALRKKLAECALQQARLESRQETTRADTSGTSTATGMGLNHPALAPALMSVAALTGMGALVLPQFTTLLAVLGMALGMAGAMLMLQTRARRTEAASREAARQSAQAQLQQLAQGMTRLLEEVAALQHACGLADTNDTTLERAEARLEALREAVATHRRLMADHDTRVQEHAALATRLHHMQGEATAADQAEAAALAHWQDHLATLGFAPGCAPADAQTLFNRIDAARLRLEAVATAHATLHTLQQRIDAFTTQARALDAVNATLADDTSPRHIIAAVRSLLEALRRGEALRQDHQRVAEALAARTDQRDRAVAALDAAQQAHQQAQAGTASAQAAWAQWLTAHGLEEGLSPATARDALRIMEEALQHDGEAAAQQQRLAAAQQVRNHFAGTLHDLTQRLGRAPQPLAGTGGNGDTYDTATCDWLATLDTLLAHGEAARNQQAEQTALLAAQTELQQELAAAQAALADASADVARLLTAGDAADAEIFRTRAAAHAERRQLLARSDELTTALRLAAGDTTLEAFHAALAAADHASLQQQLHDATDLLADLQRQESETVEQLAHVRAQLETLATTDAMASLRQQAASLQEEIRTLATDWARHALALHLLTEARRRFEQERQPQVIRAASAMFSTITDGRWERVIAPMEGDQQLLVLGPQGEPVPTTQLSRGTQEQLYLALRLAYINSHAAHAEPLPVVMDDILVNFDPGRASRTALALQALVRHNEMPHQVLFFTCHPHTVDTLRGVMPEAALFHMENGRITRGD